MSSQYGRTAIRATSHLQSGAESCPQAAWAQAAEKVILSLESRKKVCPRSTFLGLCSAGLVRKVPAGDYIDMSGNPQYAIKAVQVLDKCPELAQSPGKLWIKVVGPDGPVHNSQIDVVIALWNKGLIED